MPPPYPPIKIMLGTPRYPDGTPIYGGEYSTITNGGREVWLVRGDWRSKKALHHERGHAFCRSLLNSYHRTGIMQILGLPYTPWFWGDMSYGPMDENDLPEAYEERFADAYMRCCIAPPKRLSNKDRQFRAYILREVV